MNLDGIQTILDNIKNEKQLASYELQEAIRVLSQKEKELAQKEAAEKKKREEEKKRLREKQKKHRKEGSLSEDTNMDMPLSWENVFYNDDRAKGLHFDSIPDALIKCLNTLGKVDIEYISAITGESCKSVITALKGSIYQNPDTWEECVYKGWETADEYLSGNLMRKWKTAKTANKTYKGYFQNNLRALEKVLPPAVASEDIYITLGSPWVPSDIIDDFIEHLYQDCKPSDMFNDYDQLLSAKGVSLSVKHDEITGSWEIPHKTRYNHCVVDRSRFGTERMETLYILEKTLNMRTIAVKDEISMPKGKTKRVINKTETVLAQEKQQKLIHEFQDWVWKNKARKERLEMIFENRYSCVRQRHFDGSFLEFPTMDPKVSLYPHQKNAVARILFTPNTLLAHEVGSGKTYTMIAAGMELKRMGISTKNLFVVPNNIVGQWKTIFETMYPSASLLIVTPNSFKPDKRQDVLTKIRDNDYDGIIMAYSCFEQIQLSNRENLVQLNEIKNQLEETMKDPLKRTAKIRKESEKIRKTLAELSSTLNLLTFDISFDELGITRLFLDEAHNYKNVPLKTKISKALGISSGGSKKCKNMLAKVQCVQAHGGGVIMATGTPITNSITDAFVMQKYLQNGELSLLDLQHFDSWVGMFAEQKTEFEVDIDTSGYRMATRFSKFHNLPELSALLGQVADFHQTDKTNGIPEFDDYSDVLIPKTRRFADYLDEISNRARNVRSGIVARNVDNMLCITTDGRKAALDIRLVDSQEIFTWQSKVAVCAENIFDIYQKTKNTNSAQLVFCDTSTPKSDFNLYDELRRLLEGMGIPKAQIAYVHDADSEKKKQQLFSQVRKGDVRVLIGSTFKLGLGVNVQDKLIAMHHLDIPWRPADMAQREGRILRQGNENAKIQIYRYITEGSFDAYSWQLLETKQRFISDLLSGSYELRSGSDISNTVLSYAEVKALAIGNPLVKERVEVSNELTRMLAVQRKTIENRNDLEQELTVIPNKIKRLTARIKAAKLDEQHYQKYLQKNPAPTNKEEKKKLEESRRRLRRQLFKTVHEHECESREKTLMTYRGFQIILPANMSTLKPYIWLEKEGRYSVELGNTETGGLIRIDHFLNNFSGYIADRKSRLQKLRERKRQINEELSIKETFSDKIETLRSKLETIDKKLGVEKS